MANDSGGRTFTGVCVLPSPGGIGLPSSMSNVSSGKTLTDSGAARPYFGSALMTSLYLHKVLGDPLAVAEQGKGVLAGFLENRLDVRHRESMNCDRILAQINLTMSRSGHGTLDAVVEEEQGDPELVLATPVGQQGIQGHLFQDARKGFAG